MMAKPDIKAKSLVRQSNALTSSAYDLGRNAKRILYLSLIQLHKNPKFNEQESGYEVVIDHDEYLKLSDDITRVHRAVKIAAEELASKSVIIYTPELDGDNEKAYKSRNWINGYDYEPRKNRTVLYFHRPVVEMIPYKKGLPFTQYLLLSASKLKNTHVMRLYELICQWRNSRNSLKIEIDWLINRFNLPVSYQKKMSDFRAKLLTLAQTEITEKTDIKFIKWVEHCEGERKNKVTHITIYWEENKTVGELEALERKKLEQESNVIFAELVAMEQSILETTQLDAFTRIMISGYKSTASDCGYKIPKGVAEKIMALKM